MSSLKDNIAPLESHLKAVPLGISTYHDLPFAIMRYDPTDEWELRREIKLLVTRLEAVGKEVHIIPMSELLWSALEQVHQKDDDEGLEAVNGKNVDQDDDTYTWVIRSKQEYFKSGVGFGVRGDFLDAHYIRDGYLFTVEGQVAPVQDEHRKLVLLGLLNSSAFQIAINAYCGQHKYSGYVNLFPSPDFERPAAKALAATVALAVRASELWHSHDQTCLLFRGVPWLLMSKTTSLTENYQAYHQAWRRHIEVMTECFLKNDELVIDLLHVVEKSEIDQIVALRDRLARLAEESLSIEECVSDLLDYCVGVAGGRWDIRLWDSQLDTLGTAPEAYPPVPPARLLGDSTIHAGRPASDYPVKIVSEGLLLDDPGHVDDILRHVRDTLEAIWIHRTEYIEKEACEALGVNELRDYFRKPGKGGFWDHHLARYTKNRRKAPIYWLLQSSKKNYGVWLYYQRLDKDILFKALVNYVEPKIRLETSRLETLRSQKAVAGETGKEAKKVIKLAEEQDDFLSELRDFEDKLRRAANLHLEPDLNDGVVLNIAPLHELVPWKEAKNYWEELLEGKYEWSSIGKQLRQRGLIIQ